VNVQLLRGYWQDLPAESPNKVKFAPPNVVEARYWAVALVVGAGVFVATSEILLGLLIVVGGLVWGALMAQQVARYRIALAVYNASLICLAQYHTFRS
jgi:hypothetical protein